MMYTVSDAAKMLNVNEETVRRWIRDGKLQAKRAVGRGGNSLCLEDIVAFANQPPRAYLLSLEAWLAENHIAYEKIDDSVAAKNGNAAAAAAGVATAGLTATSVAGAGIAATSIASAGIATGAGIASAALGPIGLGIGAVAGVAYGASKLMKRKNYQKYSIQLVEAEPNGNDNADHLATIDFACVPALDAANVDLPDQLESPADSSNEAPNAGDSLSVASPMNVLNEIACAKQLLDAGIITAEEFADIKARLIAKI